MLQSSTSNACNTESQKEKKKVLVQLLDVNSSPSGLASLGDAASEHSNRSRRNSGILLRDRRGLYIMQSSLLLPFYAGV